MSRTLRILVRATEDVDAIFNWLAARSTQGAVSWYLAFRLCVQRIAAAPESYGTATESTQLRRSLSEAFFKTRRGRRYRLIFEVTPRF